MSLYVLQEINPNRHQEIGTIGRHVGFEFTFDGYIEFRGKAVLGVGGSEDFVFKLAEVGEAHRCVEEGLAGQSKQTCVDSASGGFEGGTADLFFVVEHFKDVVEISGEDGFGDVGKAAGFQDAVNLLESLVHQSQRNVMQRFEHESDIEAVGRAGDGFGAGHDEFNVGQVADLLMQSVLNGVHFQRQHAATRPAGGDGVGDFGAAAAEFEHVLSIELQEFVPDVAFRASSVHVRAGDVRIGNVHAVILSSTSELHKRSADVK
ncbi:MAG: hypothetical protein AUJ56_02845 [Zetaproteobacteria bacterium CG1_02_49_23]|nr:MAG: hypothetical protein AUJ56_02845 [Zetaproteobacteria bacterium CG1_02_49_23]